MAKDYEDIDLPAADRKAAARGFSAERNRFVDTARNPNVGDTGDPKLRPPATRRGGKDPRAVVVQSDARVKFRKKRQTREASRRAIRAARR